MTRNENSLSARKSNMHGDAGVSTMPAYLSEKHRSLFSVLRKPCSVLMLGTVLTATGVLGIGCPQPTGPEIPTRTTPTTVTTPSTPTGTPATAVPAHNSTYGDAPYDANLGNGFNVHNFLGENTNFETNAYDKMDYYLGDQAIAYIKNRVQRWYQGMNAASKAYFQNFYNAIMAMQYTKGTYDPAHGLDDMIDAIGDATIPYISDNVENLDDVYERRAYQVCWNMHYGEAYKEGMGSDREYQSQMDLYDYNLSYDDINDSGIKNFAIGLSEANSYFADHNVNLAQEYADNNFAGTTRLYRNLLAKIANKKGVETNAMVEMHDIWAFTGSLRAAHQRTAGQHWVRHSNCECSFGNQIEQTIGDKISCLIYAESNQNTTNNLNY